MANNRKDSNSEKIVKIFTDALTSFTMSTIYSSRNDTNLFICDIKDEAKNGFRDGFGIDIDEEILWARDTSFWNSQNQGMVITDRGFYFVPDNDNRDNDFFISWNNIEKVEYKDLNFILYTHNGERQQIPYNYFLKEKNESPGFKKTLNRLAELFTKIATSVGYEEEKRFDDLLMEKMIANQYEEAREMLNKALNPNDKDDVKYTNIRLGQSYLWERDNLIQEKENVEIGEDNSRLFRFDAVLSKEGYNIDDVNRDFAVANECKRLERKAANCFEKVLKQISENLEETDKALKSSTYYNLARVAPTIEKARCYLIEALESDDENYKDAWEEDFLTLTKQIVNDSFTQNYRYKDRRFLFIVNDNKSIAGCYDEQENIPWVFTLKDLPSDIQFPLGHPQAKTLYIGHPLKPNVYIPFENATEQLFMEKIRELTYLAQCLGATEVKFRKVRGLDVSSSRMCEVNGEGSAGRKLFNAEASATISSNRAETYKANDTVEHVQTFNPIKLPFCPDGLVWLTADESCQAMVKSRLNGNMLNYTEHISSSEATTVSSSQLVSIKGSFEYLLLKASGSREVKGDKTFSKATETEWEVSITFKPLDEFDTTNTPKQIAQAQSADNLSETEQQYKEEVAFCLEDDGKIDEQERKMLERKRTKLGISEERAQQIEAMFAKQDYTDEEQEYIDTVRDIIVDGAIPDAARRLLSRERKSLNLTDERAEELEQIALKGTASDEESQELTDDEQEYVDCLNDACIDGAIPDSARRLLERTRKSLNISEERAEELEHMVLNNK